MTFGNIQTLALKIRQKSSLLDTSGGEEPWCFEWFCLGWPCHSCPVPSAIRVKPHRVTLLANDMHNRVAALLFLAMTLAVRWMETDTTSSLHVRPLDTQLKLRWYLRYPSLQWILCPWGGPNVKTSLSYLTPQILSFKFSQLWHLLPTLIPE